MLAVPSAAAKGGRALKLMYDVRSLVRVYYLLVDGSQKGDIYVTRLFGLPDSHTRLQSEAQATQIMPRAGAPGLP